MRGYAVDRIALHRDLWEKSDRLHRIEIYQKELASKMEVTQATMSLVVKDLTEEGRIKKISARQRNVGVYLVRDPASFEHQFDPYRVVGFNDLERCKLCGSFYEMGKHLPQRA